MSNYEFRFAVKSDAAEIASLLNMAYRGEGSKVGWTTEADLVGGERANPLMIDGLIARMGSKFILCCDSVTNSILGSIHVLIEGEETLYFGMLAVKPDIQAKGIGKSLIKEGERFAVENKLKTMRLTIINFRPELRAFYERLGFKLNGREEVFPLEELTKVKGVKLLEMVKLL